MLKIAIFKNAQPGLEKCVSYKKKVYLSRQLILDLIPHPKLPYFAIVTCALAQGMTSVHISRYEPDMCQYMPGKTQEYGN